jgi:hypothetical protein
MRKRTISDIVAMESFATSDDKRFKKVQRLIKKNHSIAKEGLFDFFRKKKDDEPKKKPEDPNTHYEELKQANKVSIHLHTNSVENEIKYLEELISKGIPLFNKDNDRIVKSFYFVIDNHKQILDRIDKLVDISYLDDSYKLNKERNAVEFSTFYVPVYGLAKDKEHQTYIGSGWDYYDVEDEFDQELTDEQIDQYEKLYCINEAIPTLDFIYPKNPAKKDNPRTYLEKGDPKLDKLLSLNITLIEKGLKILSIYSVKTLFKLAERADKLTHPKQIGDGDEYGLLSLISHSLGYQYELSQGFSKDFIKNYTAH